MALIFLSDPGSIIEIKRQELFFVMTREEHINNLNRRSYAKQNNNGICEILFD